MPDPLFRRDEEFSRRGEHLEALDGTTLRIGRSDRMKVNVCAVGHNFPTPGGIFKRTVSRERGTDDGVRVTLIDEFKIHKEVAGIEASAQPPIRKARLILRLARRIRAAARSLGALSQRSFREGDSLRGARMREGAERLIDKHDEVRSHAAAVLANEREHVGT